ncbi:uncharacterized protein LOC117648357 [Thrips palmi]|uniref:Uncharacterized protein LOC117648357 n=1 Tax=Thrips palmi TaxID=161013 RepID=A0A6P8Z2M8_THRPL|nr:uncharacterized protein LOC117648357 [Thrips palmi]
MDSDSPQTSPVKSCPSSPYRSPVSSPAQSVQSSPFIEIPSSPILGDSVTSPLAEKRRKLNSQEPESTIDQNEHHRRELFNDEEDGTSDNIDNGRSENLGSGEQSCIDPEDVPTPKINVNVFDQIDLPTSDHEKNDSSDIEVPTTYILDDTDSSSEAGDSTSSSSSEQGSESSIEDDTHNRISSPSESESSSESSDQDDSDDSDRFLSPKVYESELCDLTVDEGVLHLMDLFTKYKMSKKETGGILKVILKFIPKFNNMPATEYALFKYVENLCPITEERVHYYCSKCLFYLGLNEMKCNLCSADSHKFYQISLADQVRNMFEQHGLADIIDKYRQERINSATEGSYSDLLDGSEFKRVQREGMYNLTLMGHSDGISISESSDVSMWPVEWVAGELPPQIRYKYVLISGIWVDECKPYMNTLLKPFVKELQELHENGVRWVHPRTKETHVTYISVPSFCGDAPVRAQLQNILMHGGRYSCNNCEQKMKKLPSQPVVPGKRKKKRKRVFMFQEDEATLRTASRMEEQGIITRQKYEEHGVCSKKVRPEKGVKGPSVISEIPGCDRSTAVFPEYMHLLLCVIKEMMTLWFVKDGPWSLKEHQDEINKFLKNLRVPDFITRIPRSTAKFSQWKANELRSFVLYYSVIIFEKFMKPNYFQHWLLFVHGIYLLLQESVSEKDRQRAHILLRMFCRQFANLYGASYCTFYIHNITHLALTVKRHGPLHCNSAFMLEDFNGTLAKYVHGTKHQGRELVTNVKLAMGVEVLRVRCYGNQGGILEKKIEFKNEIRGFSFSEDEAKLFFSSDMNAKKKSKVYQRAVIGRAKFTCSLYLRQKKRCNYSIMYVDSCGNNVFGDIRYYCESGLSKRALVDKFRVDHTKSFCHTESGIVIKHIVPIIRTRDMEVIDLNNIVCKVVSIGNFVCMRPNKHEYNL